MVFIFIFFLELVILYFLSRKLIKNIYSLLYRITQNKKWASYLLAILFLPGTFVHEISHFLAALFLLVPVGEVEFLPKALGGGVQLGSVTIGKTDPIRRFLVGITPFIFGLSIIFTGLYFLIINNLLANPYFIILTSYFLFSIGNTMFASKKDLEGALELFMFLAFLYLLATLAGIEFPFVERGILLSNEAIKVIRIANLLLIAPLAINLIGIFAFRYLR